ISLIFFRHPTAPRLLLMGSPQALVLGCSFRLRPRLAITDPIQSNSIESRPGRRYGKSNTILPSAANRSTERAPCPLFVVIGLPFDRCGVGYGCKGGVAEKQRSCSIGCYLPLQLNSGTKPSYLGIQKNPPSLALCPATNNCLSTSEEISDANHYAPPW
ncbi:hypothetical protein GW17_00027773, partial [Ensete ventricosum]